MTEWPTIDEVIARWQEGVGAPAEPSPVVHPSMLPPVDVVAVPGTSWQVIRRESGTWDVWDGHDWRSTGHPDLPAAYAAALELIAADPEPDGSRWVDVIAWTLIGGYPIAVGAVFALGLYHAARLVAGWLS
jgi:hypothetical protein